MSLYLFSGQHIGGSWEALLQDLEKTCKLAGAHHPWQANRSRLFKLKVTSATHHLLGFLLERSSRKWSAGGALRCAGAMWLLHYTANYAELTRTRLEVARRAEKEMKGEMWNQKRHLFMHYDTLNILFSIHQFSILLILLRVTGSLIMSSLTHIATVVVLWHDLKPKNIVIT